MKKLLTSTGRLVYSGQNEGLKLNLEIDKDIARYYRALIPKYMKCQVPRYPPHCTVVRPFKETPLCLKAWGEFDNEIVQFKYEPTVYFDNVYYWLNVWCDRLTELRAGLGMLPRSKWTLPPKQYYKCFHITIANKKY